MNFHKRNDEIVGIHLDRRHDIQMILQIPPQIQR
jgi:hypothetical protein